MKKGYVILIVLALLLIIGSIFLFFKKEGRQCGGFVGIACPKGYYCETPTDCLDCYGVCRKE